MSIVFSLILAVVWCIPVNPLTRCYHTRWRARELPCRPGLVRFAPCLVIPWYPAVSICGLDDRPKIAESLQPYEILKPRQLAVRP